MNEFEKEYYEDESFWSDGMVTDETNIKRIKSTIELIPKDVKSLLDVGCGNGVFLNSLFDRKMKMDLTGTDRSHTALKYVKTKKVQSDITNLPFNDNEFDCVSCLEVIEHLPHTVYESALAELVRVSKRFIIISVPFEEKLEDAFTKCPKCKSLFNSDLHFRNFSQTEFKELMNEYNCKNLVNFKLGEYSRYKWHKLYQKAFYPEQIYTWNSPICPLCGYSETADHTKINLNNRIVKNNKFITFLKSIPKLVWPKEKKYYWIIGLFEKL